MNDEGKYKYNSHGEILFDLFDNFYDQFNPFFRSFATSKYTFILQTINLTLVFLFLKLLSDSFLTNLIGELDGSRVFSMEIFLLVLVVIFVSTLKSNKVLRWQTLFEMSQKMTKQYFKILSIAVIGVYLIKELLQEIYGKRK